MGVDHFAEPWRKVLAMSFEQPFSVSHAFFLGGKILLESSFGGSAGTSN
jgi:hypothetical protein